MTQGSEKTFDYSGKEIRTIMLGEEPWFIASEICDVLGISDTSKAVSRLDDDEKLIRTLVVSGQNRDVLCINEPGLYGLILTSRKPEAKDFKRWIKHDVIPQIRKTGSYVDKNKSRQEIARELAIAYNDLADALDQIERDQEQLAIQAPKVKIYDEFFDASLFLDGSQVARILHPKLKLGRNKLYERFVQEGILVNRQSQSGGTTVTQQFLSQHPDFIKIVPETAPNSKTYLVIYFSPQFVAWYIQKHHLV